jgi:hypothetical protein
MSETAKQLFDSLKAMKEGAKELMPGLTNFGAEVKAELGRLGTQGSMELTSALFNGSAFVPYGPGQYTPSPAHGQEHGQENAQSQEMGRER